MKNLLKIKIIIAMLLMGLSACQKDKEQPTPVENKKPVVSAGADVEILLPVSTIVLKGTASDEDGTITSRLWTQKSGASIALLTNPLVDEVTASSLKPGEYIFEYQATDNKGAISKDGVKVIVKPAVVIPDDPNAIRLKQISYSQTDFVSFEYNTAGKLSRITSQYQSTQSDPNSISKFVYDLKYDESNKLVELNENGFRKTTYLYTNGVLRQTETRKLNGELVARRTYTFEGGKLKEEINETRNQFNEQVLIRTQFEYNAAGNLTKKIFASKGIQEANFIITDTFTYSNFDTKKKADDFRMMSPILHEVVFQTNNPRLVEYRAADGTLIKSESYTFQYRENGLPQSITSQNLQVPNAKLEGRLIYE